MRYRAGFPRVGLGVPPSHSIPGFSAGRRKPHPGRVCSPEYRDVDAPFAYVKVNMTAPFSIGWRFSTRML